MFTFWDYFLRHWKFAEQSWVPRPLRRAEQAASLIVLEWTELTLFGIPLVQMQDLDPDWRGSDKIRHADRIRKYPSLRNIHNMLGPYQIAYKNFDIPSSRTIQLVLLLTHGVFWQAENKFLFTTNTFTLCIKNKLIIPFSVLGIHIINTYLR